MHSDLMMSIRTLIAHPDCPDRDALFAVFDNTYAKTILGCLAPPGSLVQIAAALQSGWLWCCDGWERQTDELVAMITDPQCPIPSRMITTWSFVPNAFGVLRDRTDALIAWAQQRLDPEWYVELAVLLGPSDAAARLLMQSLSPLDIGTNLRRWSMGGDPDAPTVWQAMISPDLRAALREKAYSSKAFPAWGWDDAVDSDIVLREIVDDLADGWSPDHPSIRGRIGWLEHHVDPNLRVGPLAFLASIGGSDTLADAVCARIEDDPRCISLIAADVPWSRLHPRIQTVIDTTMRRSSDDQWTRTWACALGQTTVERDPTIDPNILLWRIDRGRWDDLDPSIRAALVSSIILPNHCYGWGMHPDMVTRGGGLDGRVFRFWNPDVPPDDLLAWTYAEILQEQRSRQHARVLIALLDILPQNRRMRFDPIIDGRLGGRLEATSQPPWGWADWIALPAADRQRRLRDRLAVLWGDRVTLPAVRFWRARNDGLATLALMVGEVLGLDDPSPLLAALLAQVLGIRGDETAVGSSLPFPDDLDAARRAQIERLPLDRDAQAYAAWCLSVLARRADVGADLIALHPTVAVALASVLTTEERAMVTASPASQGWDSMTNLRWGAACASEKEPLTLPIQRRL